MNSNNESDTVSDSGCELTSTYFPHEHSNNEFRSCNDVIKTKTFVNQNMWRTNVQNKTSKKLGTAFFAHPKDTVTVGTAPVTTLKAVTSTSRNLNASSSRNWTCTGLKVGSYNITMVMYLIKQF